MYSPEMQDATWSGARPMKPACSAAQASSALRRSTSSAWEVGSCQMRFARPAPASNVISSRMAGLFDFASEPANRELMTFDAGAGRERHQLAVGRLAGEVEQSGHRCR